MCHGQENVMPGQHQDKIIGMTDTFEVSVVKQLGEFLVIAGGSNRFSDSVKTARTD